MDLVVFKNVKISPDLIIVIYGGSRQSGTLDFTIDKVAVIAEWIPAEAAEVLLRKMERLWNEEYLYAYAYGAGTLLRIIFSIPAERDFTGWFPEYHIGRGSKLVTHGKSFESCAIQRQAVEAVECLIQGEYSRRFSEKAAAMFGYVHGLVLRKREQLGYFEVAGRVYDGTVPWKFI